MVRYIDVSVAEVTSKFLSIVCIQGTPDAKTIFEAVNQHAIELGLPMEKLICITDGASVMQGSRNSVTKYILEKWNSLAFKQHCVIHKEVLGVKAALKGLHLWKKLCRKFLDISNLVASAMINFNNW